MSLPEDPKNGILMMQVNQQIPSAHDDLPLGQALVMRVNNATRGFVFHDQSQKIATSSAEETLIPRARQHNPRPYSRIRWVNSDAAPAADTTTQPEAQEYQAPKRRRLESKTSKKPLLTVKRPIKNAEAIHEDAWRLILSFADPKLLLRMRYVSSMFREMLKENSIWKQSRENHFEGGVPDCPSFLTEAQYVDLLVGSGCQNGKCLRRETRKAYWVFRGRLCEDCLRQRTCTDPHDEDPTPQSMYAELFTDRQSREQYGVSLVDLVPSAQHEGGKYFAPRRTLPNGKWNTLGVRLRQWLYLRSDYSRLAEEFASILQKQYTPKMILEWTKEKYDRAISYTNIAQELTDWEASRLKSLNQAVSRKQSAQDRANFFIKKAEALKPPIEGDVLPFFAAYEAALKTCNQASDRAWDVLLPKILPYYAEAKRIKQYKEVQYQCNLSDDEVLWPKDAQLFQRLHNHRYISAKDTGETSSEQLFVLNLARDEFCRLKDNVADEDLVLLCLRNVYDRYHALAVKPNGFSYDGTMGRYKLSLDDARMIVDEIIKDHVGRKTLQSVKVLDSFRCSGCTRANVTRKWSFEEGFEHILRKHSLVVGKDLYYSRYARNFVNPAIGANHAFYRSIQRFISQRIQFPWYLLEWTQTLPLLPAHAQITKETKWDPASQEPYVQLQHCEVSQTESAFSHRYAVRQNKIEPENFTGNFVYAAGSFNSTTLDGPTVTRIALQYSLQLLKETQGAMPSLDEFLSCLPVAQKANLNMNLKYKCGVCSNNPEINKHLRFAKTPVDTNKLRQHWESKHGKDKLDWFSEMMSLPDEWQVMETMVKQDAQLRSLQIQSAERETVGLQRTVRKVPDKKASAIMGKDMSMDIFDTLFALAAHSRSHDN